MSFTDSNDEMGSSKFSSSKGTGLAVGGVGGVIVMLVAAYFGIDPKIISGIQQSTHSVSSPGNSSEEVTKALSKCVRNGKIIASELTNVPCKIYAAVSSANNVWSHPHPEAGWSNADAKKYLASEPNVKIFEGATQSGCGYANAQVGPFYCPADRTAYFDTSFFTTMLTKLGGSSGNLSQLYVVEHEIGHHVQNIMGFKARNHRSGATSDSVRLELQADCFAGFWASQADKGNNPLLKKITDKQLHDAITTAWAIGDDTLQSKAGRIEPSSFTHGKSEQRAKWFKIGYQGNYSACNTWNTSHI